MHCYCQLSFYIYIHNYKENIFTFSSVVNIPECLHFRGCLQLWVFLLFLIKDTLYVLKN